MLFCSFRLLGQKKLKPTCLFSLCCVLLPLYLKLTKKETNLEPTCLFSLCCALFLSLKNKKMGFGFLTQKKTDAALPPPCFRPPSPPNNFPLLPAAFKAEGLARRQRPEGGGGGEEDEDPRGQVGDQGPPDLQPVAQVAGLVEVPGGGMLFCLLFVVWFLVLVWGEGCDEVPGRFVLFVPGSFWWREWLGIGVSLFFVPVLWWRVPFLWSCFFFFFFLWSACGEPGPGRRTRAGELRRPLRHRT